MSCWRVSLTVNGRKWAPIISAPDRDTAEGRAVAIFKKSPSFNRVSLVLVQKVQHLHDAPPLGKHPEEELM